METQRPSGFLAGLQQQVDSIFASMHISARDMIAYVTYFSIGFLVGVALKRYGKWVVGILLAAILIMSLLYYFELIFFHTVKIRTLIGLQEVHSLDDAFVILQNKIQALWIELMLIIVAILVGFKLG